MIKRECKKHGLSEYIFEGAKKYPRCKQCRKEAVQRRRRKVKKILVEYKGGCCSRCGYNKCLGALHFHHIDAKEKDFGVGYKGNTFALERLKKEVDKCDLVCSNCHAEIHEMIY